MKIRTLVIGLVSTAVLVGASFANAGLILSSNFDGRTVSGATATATFQTNGVSDPVAVEADFNLFTTSASANRIAVDRNLHNEGSWTATIGLDVEGNLIHMGIVSFQALIFNNRGALQGSNVSRDLDLSVAIVDTNDVELASVELLNVYAASGAWTPETVSFDFTGTTLAKGTSYFLAITASGQGPGNNAGFDDLLVTGTIPAPAPLGLLGVGLLLLARRKA
ncbi:hypothetical protein R0137_06980 [Congregibacter brevis]|uniref:PEP-CTERM protein-sorting domain-containing protein n=1 Tax=Congregibacter brevis TaxID=3081201 RepID=A0ABZ0IFK1_9GAMM|nr:hypothetical protein R0137_06980 [Congregibacter sp. IMCC45268]